MLPALLRHQTHRQRVGGLQLLIVRIYVRSGKPRKLDDDLVQSESRVAVTVDDQNFEPQLVALLRIVAVR
jgi:hypothetical protein